MALACVRQRHGRRDAERGFCLIFNGFSLDCGRNLDNHRGRGKTNADGESWFTVHGHQIWEKRITCHGSRFN